MDGHSQQWLGGYRLLRRLGAGGAGTVWLAEDGGGERVALKLLHPALASTEEGRRRLSREATTVNQLRCPGVARVLDVEVDDTQPFVVTEFVEGPTLAVRLGSGPLSPREVAALASSLRHTLTAVHEARIVHRDVKPSNVILNPMGPVLIDFGIAMVEDDEHLTRTGLVSGTAGFTAPELLRGGAASPATDWWSWAATLLQAATARPPFGGGVAQAVMTRVAGGDPDTAGLPASVAGLFRAALAADPTRRTEPGALVEALSRPSEWAGPPSAAGVGVPPTEVLAGAGQAEVPSAAAERTLALDASAGGPSGEDIDEGATVQFPTSGTVDSGTVDGTGAAASRERWMPLDAADDSVQEAPTQYLPPDTVDRSTRTPGLAATSQLPMDGWTQPPAPPSSAPWMGSTEGIAGPPSQVPWGGTTGQQVGSPAAWRAAEGDVDGGGEPGSVPAPWYPLNPYLWRRPRPVPVLGPLLLSGLAALPVVLGGTGSVTVAVVLLLLGTVGATHAQRERRRVRHGGERPSDTAVTLAGLPVHVLRAAVSLTTGLLAGGLVAGGAWVALRGVLGPGAPDLGWPVELLSAPGAVNWQGGGEEARALLVPVWGLVVLLLLVAWCLPTSRRLREGTRLVLHTLLPPRWSRATLGALVVVVLTATWYILTGGVV